MKKFKRFAALAAVSMLGIQLMGAGTAFAGASDASDCDFGSSDLEITLSGDDVSIWIENDKVYCDPNASGVYNSGGGPGGPEGLSVGAIESITVEMDDDESDASLYIGLEDQSGGDLAGSAAEWPDLDTFDLDVTTRVYIDGDGIDDASANRLRITVGAKSFSFEGTTATSNAPSYDITGGDGGDSIDASKATARIYADGGLGTDTIKGGSGKDHLDGGPVGSGVYNVDVIYGNGGNDTITCSGDGSASRFTQGWGGEGDDSITDCNVVAPGAGNDDIYNLGGTYAPGADPTDPADAADALVAVSYADLTKGIEWDSSELLTGGAAGEDVFESAPYTFTGSQGDDTIYDEDAVKVSGAGGDDVIKVGAGAKVLAGAGDDVVLDASADDVDDTFYGQGGNDVLRGKMGDDALFGGAGKDQTWGGPGADTCGGEVTNRCEYFKKS